MKGSLSTCNTLATMLHMSQTLSKPIVYRIPACPFSQRLEILLALKGMQDGVDFVTVDVTKPRSAELLVLTNGSTALPILQTRDGLVLKESLVILRYLDRIFSQHPVAKGDPYQHAVEDMLAMMSDGFSNQGYTMVLNQDVARRDAMRQGMLAQYAKLNQFLVQYAPEGPFLFSDFGWAEAVFTPLFMRFWFLEYYEGFELPDDPQYARVQQWREACLAHPAAQQVTREQIVKIYYDYAKGVGNGGLVSGRKRSSFAFEPSWETRPWPPSEKYTVSATDEALGL